MNLKFDAEVTQRDEVALVKLSGVIDEDNGLASLTDRISSGFVIVDLTEVERINTQGVRDWVHWMTQAESRGLDVVLVGCSPAIVAQINLVENFVGKSAVKSFYAPYYCSACDLEKVLLVELAEMVVQEPFSVPICHCDECEAVIDFDDHEESYFAFVKTTRTATLTPIQQSAVVELSSGASGDERRVRSRVSGVSPARSASKSESDSASEVSGRASDDGLAVEAELQPSEQTTPRVNLTLIVVIILLGLAITLLLYVLLSSDFNRSEKRPEGPDPGGQRPAPTRHDPRALSARF